MSEAATVTRLRDYKLARGYAASDGADWAVLSTPRRHAYIAQARLANTNLDMRLRAMLNDCPPGKLVTHDWFEDELARADPC